MNTQNDWLLRSALRNSESNYPQYPQQFGAGSKLNSIDLAYLKDLDLSSTTESPSTLAATNKEVESSTSFEYQENKLVRQSPFQREIQRLLDSSASKVLPVINRPPVSMNDGQNSKIMKTNINAQIKDTNSAIQVNKFAGECDSSQGHLSGTSPSIATVNGKHPVGLEAIKEIARNTANSDSSQM